MKGKGRDREREKKKRRRGRAREQRDRERGGRGERAERQRERGTRRESRLKYQLPDVVDQDRAEVHAGLFRKLCGKIIYRPQHNSPMLLAVW